MIIVRDLTQDCFTIKRTIQHKSHVRIGLICISFWADDRPFGSIGLDDALRFRKLGRPHSELSLLDCKDLLEELEELNANKV